jgi:hypothetical protein
MFRVRFVNLKEQTVTASDYNELFDAIKVAKETNIGPDRITRVAIPDSTFNHHFVDLLKHGYIYVGPRSEEFPNGDYMVQLLRVNNRGEERPVLSPVDEAVNWHGLVTNQLIHKTEPGAGNYS